MKQLWTGDTLVRGDNSEILPNIAKIMKVYFGKCLLPSAEQCTVCRRDGCLAWMESTNRTGTASGQEPAFLSSSPQRDSLYLGQIFLNLIKSLLPVPVYYPSQQMTRHETLHCSEDLPASETSTQHLKQKFLSQGPDTSAINVT